MASENEESLTIIRRCSCDPRFSHLDLWQTDGHTHDESKYRASLASRV